MIKDVECLNLQVLDLRESKDYHNDKKWILNDFWELNDSILLENDLNTLIMDNYTRKTIVITPRKTKINLNKLVYKPELGKIYQMLKEIHEFKLDLLLRRIEYDKLILKYAIKVFLELDLIYKKDDFYVVRENALKTDLQKSSTYVKLEEVKKLTDFLYQDYISHIRTYFRKQMEE